MELVEWRCEGIGRTGGQEDNGRNIDAGGHDQSTRRGRRERFAPNVDANMGTIHNETDIVGGALDKSAIERTTKGTPGAWSAA